MRNRIRNYILVLVAVVNIVLNVILFITVTNVDKQLSNAAFWITWIFTFPLNILFWVYLYISTRNAKDEDEVNLLPLLRTAFIGNLAYLLFGMITMYLPSAKYSWKLALILNIIFMLIYVFFFIFVQYGISYIRKSRETTKKKVFYIRDLASDLVAIYGYISDSETLTKVQALADDIKFSDPMSHESLIDIETELKMIVSEIVNAAMNGDFDTVNKNIVLASNKLKFRNTKCAILK